MAYSKFTIRHALAIALMLHILPLLLDRMLGGQISKALFTADASAQKESEPIEFRFVDIPDEKLEPKTEPSKSKFLSDMERRAKTLEPKKAPETEAPRLAGTSPREMTLPQNIYRLPPPKEHFPDAEDKSEQKMPKTEKGETHQEPKPNPQKEFRKSLETFIQDLGPPGYYNPDGSISTLGKPTFDTADFDFGPYAKRLYWKVRSNWHPSPLMSFVGKTWETILEFDILRDGTVENLRVIKESGISSYDREALYSILASYPLESLPAGYAHERVGVRWHFYYHVY